MRAWLKKGWGRGRDIDHPKALVIGTVLGKNVMVGQSWTPIKWDDSEDPDWFKTAGLVFDERPGDAVLDDAEIEAYRLALRIEDETQKFIERIKAIRHGSGESQEEST